jgi:hypothetical protein
MLNLTLDELKDVVAEADNFCHSTMACVFCPAKCICDSDATGFANLVISFVERKLEEKNNGK